MEAQEFRLVERRQIAEGTLEFHFEKPKGFTFKAGQHINIKLSELAHEDGKGPRRTFTLASSPGESELMICTRMTGSGFKKTLAQLDIGSSLEFIGPMGEFTLRAEDTNVVMIAGGIGITPFRSMLLDLSAERAPSSLSLFYSNRILESAAYHDLFVQLQHSRGWPFNYVPTLTDTGDSGTDWSGERRKIDLEFLRHYTADFSSNRFYLCGPPGMVKALTDTLSGAGLDAGDIRSESFWGY